MPMNAYWYQEMRCWTPKVYRWSLMTKSKMAEVKEISFKQNQLLIMERYGGDVQIEFWAIGTISDLRLLTEINHDSSQGAVALVHIPAFEFLLFFSSSIYGKSNLQYDKVCYSILECFTVHEGQ